jgi:hypothetical protein
VGIGRGLASSPMKIRNTNFEILNKFKIRMTEIRKPELRDLEVMPEPARPRVRSSGSFGFRHFGFASDFVLGISDLGGAP